MHKVRTDLKYEQKATTNVYVIFTNHSNKFVNPAPKKGVHKREAEPSDGESRTAGQDTMYRGKK